MTSKELELKLEGSILPNVTFKINNFEGNILPGVCPIIDWSEINTENIFKGKKIVLFALPGAYTPTCSSKQLPGYESKYSEFKELGIDEVFCLSVNDPFVMNAWSKVEGVINIKLIPDGNGDFSREIGTLVDKNNLGFGKRSWRYSMYVEDMIIKKIFVEPGFSDNFDSDPYEVSDENTMLEFLKANKN